MGSIEGLVHPDTPPAGHETKLTSHVTQELRALLSSAAHVYARGQEEFDELTLRWQKYHSPDFQISVSVTSEEDIVQTIQLANVHNIPFLAVASSHGAIDMSSLQNGIQIWMRKLNTIAVDPVKNIATIGGGCLTYEVISELWKHGKQTVTGMCEAVAIPGLVLGGGHGLLQGVYGLPADQLISIRIVLWDGTVVTASETTNTDLFWALRGAGHNFGIVTEMQYRIFDVPPEKRKWASETFIFKSDRLEDVFDVANKILDTQPPEFGHFLFFKRLEDIDPVNAVIKFVLLSNNDLIPLTDFTEQVKKLGPVAHTCTEIDYPEHPGEFEVSRGDFVSQKQGATTSIMRFPTGAMRYDISATRLAFDKYNKFTTQYLQFSHSFVLLEAYSTHAVRDVPEESTAVGFRHERLFFAPVVIFQDDDDAELQRKAISFGKDVRDSFGRDSELSAYVNYAGGDEGPEAWYGYEPWRMEKLKSLKKKWDPHQKFSYFAPIPLH